MDYELDSKMNFSIKSKKLYRDFLVALTPILLVSMSTYYLNTNFRIFNLTIEILCASLGAALSIISIFENYVEDESLCKYIGYGFLFISILSFSDLVILNKLIGEFNTEVRHALVVTTFYLEYIVVIVGIFLNKRKASMKLSMLVYSIVSSLIMCINLFIILNIYGTKYINIYSNINIICLVSFAILLITLIIKNKNYSSIEEKVALLAYGVFIIIYQVLCYINYTLGSSHRIKIVILKYIAYYIMYEVMVNLLFYRSYDNIKSNLVSAQKMQKGLNDTLVIRNNMLKDFKMIIEKSERRYSSLIESIKDGVILFYFNRLSFINETAETFLESDNDKNYYDKHFDDFIELLSNKYDKYNNNLKQELIDIRDRNEKISILEIKTSEDNSYEIYFIEIDNLNKFIYIKDMREIKRYYDLRKKYEECLNEEKVKNEFYSNISHELRTPINLIYSALQLNEIYLNDDNYDNINKNNNAIKQNCFRLIRTINNFIDTNKISEGYLNNNIKIYNIVSVVENISLACNKYVEMIDNTLIFDVNEEEIYVECDKDIIERIILNLLSNSVKYGKNGGIIFVEIEARNEEVFIYVRNNGYCIDEEVQPYIFDKFTKVNKSFNREKEGSGLGLFLSKKLVELQGGCIELVSNEEKGTEFKIMFNRCYEKERAEEDEIFVIDRFNEKVDIEFSDIYL